MKLYSSICKPICSDIQFLTPAHMALNAAFFEHLQADLFGHASSDANNTGPRTLNAALFEHLQADLFGHAISNPKNMTWNAALSAHFQIYSDMHSVLLWETILSFVAFFRFWFLVGSGRRCLPAPASFCQFHVQNDSFQRPASQGVGGRPATTIDPWSDTFGPKGLPNLRVVRTGGWVALGLWRKAPNLGRNACPS